MAVIWSLIKNENRGGIRRLTVKRVVDGNQETAIEISENFSDGETKIDIKNRFKDAFLAEKQKKQSRSMTLSDLDFADFETEVNAPKPTVVV